MNNNLIFPLFNLIFLIINRKMEAPAIYPELNAIESEIKNLKILISQHQKQKKIVSLKGMLKGVKIKEKDFSEAKKYHD